MANRPLDKIKLENDLFLEMLEVYINSILYVREVYPAAIFTRRRVYSTAAYISIFPPLSQYLLNILKMAQELKAANKLFQVELIIFEREIDLFGTPDDEEVIERYIFRVEQDENEDKKELDIDLYIIQFEEELRRGLIQLEQTAKNLKRLNTDCCGFRIQLETTESSYVDIVNKENSKSESFPWVVARDKYNENVSTPWQMNPVLQVNPFSLLLLTSKKS
ncbi:DNA polymerase zeta subunit 2 [Sitodiplosis mosellana]|uniref:DNA polymerase zeta subunit 2 n=1 Tax=Sitodiplosis mosellana TaxID=263140 RepID=UPI0024447A22|nr:DNA polymerase zeta subunit 2 [Sitodiplosis mosellana]